MNELIVSCKNNRINKAKYITLAEDSTSKFCQGKGEAPEFMFYVTVVAG